MNVVIYARFSSHSQTEQSIEGQLKVCYEYAESNHYTVVGEYIDRAISGTTDNRAEFQRMISDSDKHTFEGVLVYQLDRFARNRYDSAINKAKLKKNGVRVLSAKENIADDASGILVEGVLESMAEYYSVELSQKIHRGMAINAEKCLSNGSNPGLGFKVDGERRFYVDEEEAAIVREIYERYASGETKAEIIRDLKRRRVKTSLGKEFSPNSLSHLLSNKRYIGVYLYKGKETPGGMPRILDDDLFYRVQSMMNKNKNAPARTHGEGEYLLTTKLFCGHCKEMMVGYGGTSKTGRQYHYYMCKNARRKKCGKKIVSKSYIEDRVVNECLKMLTEEKIRFIAKKVAEECAKSPDNLTAKALKKAIREANTAIENLWKAIEQGQAVEMLTDRLNKRMAEKAELEAQLAIEENKKITLTEAQILAFLDYVCEMPADDVNKRRAIINIFVHSIYLYDDHFTLIINASKKPLSIDNIPLDDIETAFEGETGASEGCSSLGTPAPPVTRILLLRCSCYFYTHARFSNLRLIFTRYDKICIIIPEGDPMRILLAEDEKSLNRIITKQLKAAGYSVDSCFDGGEAYDLIASTDYDAAVFDVMMPIMNGFELVKKIRAHGIDTPVLFLTARDSIEDRVTGLDIGADDYLIKPFSFDELSARLRVMTRKKYGEKTGIISVGDLTVDTAARRVERAGREISLSAKEYELLQYLVMNKGVVLSREKIEDHIWNYDYEGGTNVVDVYIRYLRKKIDEGEDIKLIHTVRGAGYVIK